MIYSSPILFEFLYSSFAFGMYPSTTNTRLFTLLKGEMEAGQISFSEEREQSHDTTTTSSHQRKFPKFFFDEETETLQEKASTGNNTSEIQTLPSQQDILRLRGGTWEFLKNLDRPAEAELNLHHMEEVLSIMKELFPQQSPIQRCK